MFSPEIDLITRISRIELPYLRAFLEYYNDLKVTRFYLINTDSLNCSEVESFSRELGQTLNLEMSILPPNENRAWLKDYSIVQHTKGTYLAVFDVDEFVDTKGKPFPEYVASQNYEYQYYHWIMSPQDYLLENNLAPNGYTGNTGKYIIRQKNAVSLGEHVAILSGLIAPQKEAGTLIHFWGRSFQDVVLKSAYHRFFDLKHSSVDEIKNSLRQKKLLPRRLQLLAILSCLERPVTFSFSDSLIDRNLEYSLIGEILTPTELHDLYELYSRVKSQVPDKWKKLFPGKTIMQIASLLQTEDPDWLSVG